MDVEDQIEQHKLDSRLKYRDKVKWVTGYELLEMYGEEIDPLQEEMIREDLDRKYPVSK